MQISRVFVEILASILSESKVRLYLLNNVVLKQNFKFCHQTYEARIDALQRQVEEQSMTMSMYSSYTPEDFNTEEDIFGE